MVDELPEGTQTVRMVPSALASSAHLMPALLELAGLNAAQLAEMLQALDDVQLASKASPVAVFLHTEVDRATFIKQWNALQLHRNGAAASWLRLHDVRVLHQMLRVLTPAQQLRLFGCADKLTYALGGQWLSVERPAIAPAVASTWDWRRIERIGLVNRALSRAEIVSPAALREKGAIAETLIERATARHGLIDPEDLVEFAYRGLAFGGAFDEHPAVAPRLPRQNHEDDSLLADRLALIDPETWLSVALPLAHFTSAADDR